MSNDVQQDLQTLEQLLQAIIEEKAEIINASSEGDAEKEKRLRELRVEFSTRNPILRGASISPTVLPAFAEAKAKGIEDVSTRPLIRAINDSLTIEIDRRISDELRLELDTMNNRYSRILRQTRDRESDGRVQGLVTVCVASCVVAFGLALSGTDWLRESPEPVSRVTCHVSESASLEACIESNVQALNNAGVDVDPGNVQWTVIPGP